MFLQVVYVKSCQPGLKQTHANLRRPSNTGRARVCGAHLGSQAQHESPLLATKARMRSVEFYRVPGVSNFPRTVLGVQPAPESKQDVSQLRDLH